MIDKLLCPFCQQELKPQTMDGEWLECWNCSYYEQSHYPFPQRILCGTKELWQELIRTRKALDLALEALTTIGGYLDYNDCVGIALDAKDEIYETLEQKE